MEVKELPLKGVKLVQPKVYHDDRGYFLELYRSFSYPQEGVESTFVQDNCSVSKKNVIRGMHFQRSPGQAKLVSVLDGEIFDVVVDLRPDSSTFGKWLGVTLNSKTHAQLYIPPQCAHGFCVLSDQACVMYKVSSPFDSSEERAFRYDDPEIGIEWPVNAPILSEKDSSAPLFSEVVS